MILHSFRKRAAIRRFDRRHHHSSFPAKSKAPVAQNFGPTPPLGHRLAGAGQSSRLHVRALSEPELRTSAGSWHVRTAACLVALMTLSVLSFSFVASAGKSTSNGAAGSTKWASYIAEASQRFSVPAHWIRAVMQLESNGDTIALSPKGAMGLMQIMPQTYAELRLRYHLGADPYVPRSNILAGAAYLRELQERYGPTGFLAAYNAGPGRYEDYLMRGRPLPEETQNYVATLAPIMGVPELPRHPENTPVPSPSAPFVESFDKKSQSAALSENRFLPRKTPFENRRNARTGLLFAALHDAFERTSSRMQMVDVTALEPSANHALSAISTPGEHALNRISKVAQSSLKPNGNALFAMRSGHSGK
ncbi:MAG: lytic transglycosylase domain-containing protein [Methylocella sp.]